MKPEDYFLNEYQSDLKVFNEISYSESYDLCPLTLTVHLNDTRIKNIKHIHCFFSVQYSLNLISQALHSHFNYQYYMWKERVCEYLDIQGCYAHSFRGGNYTRPIDLIKFLNQHDIKIDNLMLLMYTKYFLENELEKYTEHITISNFSNKLLSDNDCMEIHDLLKSLEQG